MDLEFHQLDLRYERLRRHDAEREKRLVASLARIGQQVPVVVVNGESDRFVLVDGYKRVRALVRLREDTVLATRWDLCEADALLLERLMLRQGGDPPLEQGWLLRELRDRFQLAIEELARRFDKSPSWASRRLGLVEALPESIQGHVQHGRITPHAAMRFFVPLARANMQEAIQLADVLAPLRLSTRKTGLLCVAFASGSERVRASLLAEPALFLRARNSTASLDKSPSALLIDDLGALTGIARRIDRRLDAGNARSLAPSEREDVRQAVTRACTVAEKTLHRLGREVTDAGSVPA